MKKNSRLLLLVAPLMFLFQSCWMYKFRGDSVPPTMKTVAVEFFENNAPIVVPRLSQAFTEELRNRIRNQSRLTVVRDNAEGIFEGRITDYSFTNVAVTANERSDLVRLTISVEVKYTNTIRPEDNFEQSFSQFEQFSLSNGSIQVQEPRIIPLVTKRLTEDIFNKAFANW